MNCLNVSWIKIESGACPVFYTVWYNETTLISGTKLLNYVQCNFNAFANDTVSVRAEVGGRIGDFTDAKIILTTPPPPPTTTTTTASASSSTTPSPKGRLLCHNLKYALNFEYVILLSPFLLNTHTHTHTHTRTHAHTHRWTHAHTHACMHAHYLVSDFHKMTLTILKTEYVKADHVQINYRNYKNFSPTLFKTDLRSSLMENELSNRNFDTFQNTL